ncbi:hypothetical protein [Streptomyces sp. NPDC001652]|uniref:hypothetical protein n=1 Tax=Streptomyces sp. NPDC001652 TaxID=3154393 RepID=UPI00332D565B
MDEETARVFGELREVAAGLGLIVHPMSTEDVLEEGRRAWLSLGYRFHLTRSAAGSPLASGWCTNADTARDRFAAAVDEYGGRPGAVITLIDEAERRTLAVHPGRLS